MTATIARSSARVPPSQNTAPVHEYRCLYSHDIRRKSKRWQDGFVKFHTFNKRVMVYDEGRNFLGDTHWKEQGDLQADDEVTLEIGVLVQVGDILATSQTDLAPLFERERKRPEEEDEDGNGHENMNGLSTAARITLGGRTNAAPRVYKKQMSLNALLGTPKGAIGRSTLPARSPYEIRNSNNKNNFEDNHSVKRRKIDQPWSVTRISKEMPLWAKTSDSRTTLLQKSKGNSLAAPRPLTVKEVVDITSDDENFSDVTIPSTPAKMPAPLFVSMAKTAAKTPASRISKPKTTPRLDAPSSPPVSARNHFEVVDTGTTVEMTRSRGMSTAKVTSVPGITEDSAPRKPKSAPTIKPLRIARSQPRSMLLCQTSTQMRGGPSQPAQKSRQTADTAKGAQPDAGPTLLETLIAARRPRVDPFACLSDSDDDTSLSKAALKRTQPKNKEAAFSKPAAGPSKTRTVTLASVGTNRLSSPAFSTMAPPPEHFEPVNPSVAPASLHPPTASRRQRIPDVLPRSSDMEKLQSLIDQQIYASSNAQAARTRMAPPPVVPRPKPTAVVTPLPPFPEQNAEAPSLPSTKTAAGMRILPQVKPTAKSPFRRVRSEGDADLTIDIVSSPMEEPGPGPVPASLRSSQEELLRRVQTRSKKTPRKPLQRSTSLATGTKEKAKAVTRAKARQAEPVPERKTETGPWTIEATDLFDWRPPDWEERVKKRLMEFGY